MGPTRIVGVLNVTSDSFFDGGVYAKVEDALKRAHTMQEQGVAWIDIGAESTRPGSEPVSEEEELKRLHVILPRLVKEVSIPVSIDTSKSRVAAWALEQGVQMLNDVSALRNDAEMVKVVADAKAPVVMMHALGPPKTMQNQPFYQDVVADICAFFEERLEYCCAHGVAQNQVILDPGIGFGKTLGHNRMILQAMPRWKSLGQELFFGVSRKGLLGDLLGCEPSERLAGTLALHTWLIEHEVDYLRVHDVQETVDVMRVWASLKEA